MSDHGSDLKTYLTIFGALMVLTAVTVGVAYAELGALAGPIALLIAAVKATLVILYFMHVKYETKLIGLWALSGFIFVAILIVITLGEFAGRPTHGEDILQPALPTNTADQQ